MSQPDHALPQISDAPPASRAGGVEVTSLSLTGAHGSVSVTLSSAGDGRPVIAFGSGLVGSPAHAELAKRFRVTAIETTETDPRRVGSAAAAWALAQGLEHVGLLALAEGARTAFWCAAELGDRANALVLCSPLGLPIASDSEGDGPNADGSADTHAAGSRQTEPPSASKPGESATEHDDPLRPLLRELKVPKAILLGTRDPDVPRPTSGIKRSFSRAHIVLVFGASRTVHLDRPEAFASAAGDFLDRQARFRLATETVAVLP